MYTSRIPRHTTTHPGDDECDSTVVTFTLQINRTRSNRKTVLEEDDRQCAQRALERNRPCAAAMTIIVNSKLFIGNESTVTAQASLRW